ncbi:uncharacterized protein HaLaN_33063, partial [Haematococcus lacustris]
EPWFPPIVVPAAPVHSPSSANAASRPSTPEAAARSSGGVVLQCSSQGRLTPAWLLQEFGGPGIRQESGLGAWRQPPLPSSQAAQNKLHLVWPTVQEVRDSLEGWAAGGSIPGKAANIQSSL